ncbi:MAG: hypothetical protein P1U63_12215 [Coxiellaceae bacterium]|nr:hypothetical protein [Coxiellaceae bacterium]
MPNVFEQGSNSQTERVNDRILKRRKQEQAIQFEQDYIKQASMWNLYYNGTGLDTAVVDENGVFSGMVQKQSDLGNNRRK